MSRRLNGKIAAQGIHFRNFSEGLGLVVEPRNRTTFADINGEVRISWPRATPPPSLRQPLLSEGLTLVSIGNYQTMGMPFRGGWFGGQRVAYSFMNKQGKLLNLKLPKERLIIDAFPFSEGYAVIQTAIAKRDPYARKRFRIQATN